MKPGIHSISNEDYHGGAGVSRSQLWTLWSRTPAHMRYGDNEPKTEFAIGGVAHTAILEPDLMTARYMVGPNARGNSNIWKQAELEAAASGKLLVKPDEWNMGIAVRDSAYKNPMVRRLMEAPVIEQSGYWTDKETGVLCRVRPDIYSERHALLADIKTAANAAASKFTRSALDFGYHLQEAMYPEGWINAGGGDVDGFLFIVIEKDPPFMVVAYELEESASAEGFAVYRAALRKYATCLELDRWPGYPESVQKIDIPRWGYSQTTAPGSQEIGV